jgi:hypothetical protein
MSGMKTLFAATLATTLWLSTVGGAAAQCMLANPSFEHPGTPFAGWTAFGPVTSIGNAPHGAVAANVAGPNDGTWNVAGVWQSLPCTPGQSFTASTIVRVSSAAPLVGGSAALLNIEWRDSGGNLLSYESHSAADPSTPTDVWRVYTVQSGAAPSGTASIHFVLGVLQGPSDPQPQVAFDSPDCYLVSPSHAALQWSDFGSGRTINFSGRTWRVKGTGNYGPGPNNFDASTSATWVDALGRLHLTIRKVSNSWYSSEIALDTPLGYGDYIFTTRGRLDQLDRNVILGMFLWEYGGCYNTSYLWWNPYNEIDVEFSRWGSAAAADCQFVCQPAGGGNTHRFDVAFADSEVTSHAFRWLPGKVEYRSWRGGPDAEATSTQIQAWTYTGQDLPRPEEPRVHLNLWQIANPSNGLNQEVIFDAMTFHSACASGNCGVLAVPPATTSPSGASLAPAAPNPFAGGTVIRYSLPVAGPVEVGVYDLAGRRIRTLVSATLAAGEHSVEWNRTDDDGARVAPGVYLYRLRANGVSEAKRMIVLH